MKRYKLNLHKAVVPDKPLLDTPKERKGFLHFTAVLDVDDDETVDTFFSICFLSQIGFHNSSLFLSEVIACCLFVYLHNNLFTL